MNRHITLFALASLVIGLPDVNAGPAKEARITQTSNDVQLIDANGAPRPALVNDKLAEKTTLRTGADSRAEVTFSDKAVARLAADTSFSFENGSHDLNLEKGAVLVQMPRRARGAKIHAGAVAAAVAGTTAMLEYHPSVCKFLVLEGTGRLYRPRHLGDSVLVRPGQMIINNPNNALADPVDFDIGRFAKTSRFLVDLPPLRSEQSIAAETQKQLREKSKKTLIDTNLVIFGGGTLVSITKPAPAKSGSDEIPASADMGTIEPPHPVPNPAASPVGLPPVDPAADIPR